MKKKIKMHLVGTKDIVASWDDSFFKDSTEQSMDDVSHTIKDVCVFGSRHSKNGYTYTDKAISKLCSLTHGVKFFIDHPSASSMKENEGVRSMHSWAGMFTNSHQNGDKVFADLVVRESFWPLVRDVAIMKPSGIGNSINSRVQVFKNDKGEESIIDIDILKSVDLVSAAATTTSLWESIPETTTEQDERDEEFFSTITEDDEKNIIVRDVLIAIAMERSFSTSNKEGILKDRIKARETIRAINKLQWDASDVIDEILREKDKKMLDKKKEIASVLDDLESEINKIMGGKLPKTDSIDNEAPIHEKENEMDFKDLTLETLSKERPDLITDIKATLENADRISNTESALKEAKSKLEELTTSHTELEGANKELTKESGTSKKENEDLKKKVDEHESKDKKTAKEALIAKKIEEAKLPKDAISDVFIADLMSKDEEGIDASIKDRQEMWNIKTAGVKGSGDEFVEKTEAETKSASEKFKAKIKK